MKQLNYKYINVTLPFLLIAIENYMPHVILNIFYIAITY